MMSVYSTVSSEPLQIISNEDILTIQTLALCDALVSSGVYKSSYLLTYLLSWLSQTSKATEIDCERNPKSHTPEVRSRRQIESETRQIGGAV